MAAVEVELLDSQQFTDISEYSFSGNEVTVERKRTFITLYREHGTVYHAAYYTPVARKTVYQWLQVDEQFAEAFADSKEDSLDDLESSVYKRAFKDSILAMFYLKAHRPKFRDKVSIDVEVVKDEISQRLSQLGLERLPMATLSENSNQLLPASIMTESTVGIATVDISHFSDSPELLQKENTDNNPSSDS